MTPELVERYAAPVPRYTSYPPAPQFSPAITAATYRGWLTALPAGTPLSLYFHIPFCHELCWYCGCSTKATKRAGPVDAYLPVLISEIGNVSALMKGHQTVEHIHWGGGSPNSLTPEAINRLSDAIKARFEIAPAAEFAVEIDSRTLSEEQVAAFAAAGVNRVSLGVQDFNTEVQKAINRIQPFEVTKRSVDLFRAYGVKSINIDLVYGLPHQTEATVAETMARTLALSPDRIAVFGYAHLPRRFRHQRLIADAALPGPLERFGQSQCLSRILAGAGFIRIGLDHYARPGDPLAEGNVRRNFQGYTSDKAEALIGFGASAISKLPQGYAQNAPGTPDYVARIDGQGLATARGIALSRDDEMRAAVIERLMCDFQFSGTKLLEEFGQAAEQVLAEAEALVAADHDGFVRRTQDGFAVTEKGRPFIRSISACFDAYLGTGGASHALAV